MKHTVPSVKLGDADVEVRNIYCIGRNYAEHAKELNNPVPATPLVFLKSSASLRGLQPTPMAFADDVFHHEVELVLLVGKHLQSGERATNAAVAGFGLGLDLTRRDVQAALKKDGHPWTLAKSFTGSAMVAPLLAFDGTTNLEAVNFGLDVNGERKQFGSSADMLVKPLALLTYLLSFNNLFPGDLIFTGTPKGVGPLRKGDKFRLFMHGISYDHSGVC